LDNATKTLLALLKVTADVLWLLWQYLDNDLLELSTDD
jgi:hypothetical protein